jgi:hypothetical protein
MMFAFSAIDILMNSALDCIPSLAMALLTCLASVVPMRVAIFLSFAICSRSLGMDAISKNLFFKIFKGLIWKL